MWHALTFTFLSIVCLIRRMDLPRFCQLLSYRAPPHTLSIMLKDGFLQPDCAAEEPLSLSVMLPHSPVSVRGHASSSQRYVENLVFICLGRKMYLRMSAHKAGYR